MPKPTPEELLLKQKKRNLLITTNRILSGVSFKTVKVWTDAYKLMGRDTVDDRPIIFKELKAFLDNLMVEIDRKVSPTHISDSTINKKVTEHLEQDKVVTFIGNKDVGKSSVVNVVKELFPQESTAIVKNGDNGDIKTYNYGYIKSPNESKNFFPYWFQRKCIVEAVDNTVKYKKRGQLILAGTGTGKTFIAGGYIRRLLDINFTENLTYGPVHYLYITRATIVEQTKRVFRKNFNITMADGVEVLNIEQLRSRAGKMWVDEKMEIVDGEETYYWTWRKNIHPPILILDECQSVKNIDSTQSKIIQAYADLPGVRSFVMFLSATPFLRVTESKAFVLNCHIEDNELSV